MQLHERLAAAAPRDQRTRPRPPQAVVRVGAAESDARRRLSQIERGAGEPVGEGGVSDLHEPGDDSAPQVLPGSAAPPFVSAPGWVPIQTQMGWLSRFWG